MVIENEAIEDVVTHRVTLIPGEPPTQGEVEAIIENRRCPGCLCIRGEGLRICIDVAIIRLDHAGDELEGTRLAVRGRFIEVIEATDVLDALSEGADQLELLRILITVDGVEDREAEAEGLGVVHVHLRVERADPRQRLEGEFR